MTYAIATANPRVHDADVNSDDGSPDCYLRPVWSYFRNRRRRAPGLNSTYYLLV